MSDETQTPADTNHVGISNARPPNEDAALSMVNDLIAQGVDPERVNAAAKASGYQFEPDERTPDQREFDDAFGAPDDPREYKINYYGRLNGIAETDAGALGEFDTAAKEWLSDLQFPAEIGASVFETMMDVGQGVGRLSPAEQKAWREQQDARLTQLTGNAEKAATARKIAETVLEFGPKEFTDRLRASGALNDAGVIVHLALQGQRMAHRGKLRSS